MPQTESTQRKPKVRVLTEVGRSQFDAARAALEEDDYEVTLTTRDADFVVLDLSHPPREWLAEIVDRKKRYVEVPAPVFLCFLDDGHKAPEADTIVEALKAHLVELRILSSLSRFSTDADWLRSLMTKTLVKTELYDHIFHLASQMALHSMRST